MSNENNNRQPLGEAATPQDLDNIFGQTPAQPSDDGMQAGGVPMDGGDITTDEGTPGFGQAQQPQQTQAQQATPPTTLTQEQIASLAAQMGTAVAEAVKPVAQPPTPQSPPLTPEQARQALGWFTADEALAQQITGSDDPAVNKRVAAALNRMHEGQTQQFANILRVYTGETLTRELKPLADQVKEFTTFREQQEAYRREAEAQQFQNDFYSRYPQLTEYSVLVDAVADKLGDIKGTREEIMQKYAEGAIQVINSIRGSAGQQPVVAQAQPNPRPRGRMSPLTRGGQSSGFAQRARPQTGPYAAAKAILPIPGEAGFGQ